MQAGLVVHFVDASMRQVSARGTEGHAPSAAGRSEMPAGGKLILGRFGNRKNVATQGRRLEAHGRWCAFSRAGCIPLQFAAQPKVKVRSGIHQLPRRIRTVKEHGKFQLDDFLGFVGMANGEGGPAWPRGKVGFPHFGEV